MAHGYKAGPCPEDCVLQLDARELEVDEQAAFAAASWKELQSFFESSVAGLS